MNDKKQTEALRKVSKPIFKMTGQLWCYTCGYRTGAGMKISG